MLPFEKTHWNDEPTHASFRPVKAVIVFFLVVILGMGFVEFLDWLVAEQPTHVFRVKVAAAKPH